MRYKAIIFDLDGTLVDTLLDLAGAMNFALSQFGQPEHSPQACRGMIGDGVKMFAGRALGADEQGLCEEVLGVMKGYYRDNCFVHSSLYDGISETVERLRAMGVRLAVLTNKDQEAAERVVEHFFGAGRFEKVVGVVGDRAVKPDSWAMLGIVKAMGPGVEDFLFVGDSPVDMTTARGAQIRSVGAGWGFRGRAELAAAEADVIIDEPGEILDLVA